MILQELIKKMLENNPNDKTIETINVAEVLYFLVDKGRKEKVHEIDRELWISFANALKQSKTVKKLIFRNHFGRAELLSLVNILYKDWEILFEAISKNASIETVSFKQNVFVYADIDVMKGLMTALAQNNALQQCTINDRADQVCIVGLEDERLNAFLILAKKKEIGLNLHGVFEQFTLSERQTVRRIVTEGKVVSLDLSWCTLVEKSTDTNWKYLCEILADAKYLKRLDLSQNELGSLPLSFMELLCSSLLKCKSLTDLILHSNEFSEFNAINAKVLCKYITDQNNLRFPDVIRCLPMSLRFKRSKKELDELCTPTEGRILYLQTLFTAIKSNRNIKALSLYNTMDFYRFQLYLIQQLMETVHQSELNFLNVGHCSLNFLNDDCWNEFWKGIDNNRHKSDFLLETNACNDSGAICKMDCETTERKVSKEKTSTQENNGKNGTRKLIALNISCLKLNELSDERFNTVCNALKDQSWVHLDLSDSDLHKLSKERQEILYQTLMNCKQLTSICTSNCLLPVDENDNEAPPQYGRNFFNATNQREKSVFFAAAHSLLRVSSLKTLNQNNDSAKRIHKKETQYDNHGPLPLRIVKLILTFVPLRVAKKSEQIALENLDTSLHRNNGIMDYVQSESFEQHLLFKYTVNASQKQHTALCELVTSRVSNRNS